MNEMIELVAKALIDDDTTIFGHHQSHIAAKVSAARAAIAAMQEPTDEMLKAGRFAEPATCRAIWTAMNKAALK